jgi:hypothetical protein
MIKHTEILIFEVLTPLSIGAFVAEIATKSRHKMSQTGPV